VAETETPPAPDLDRDEGDGDVEIVLPWHYSWWRVGAVAIAATLAVVGLILVASTERRPGEGSVDVGFLQDMRTHHDQAVLMALIYMNAQDTDGGLNVMATEVLLSQQLENGIFVETLRTFGAAEENSTGIGMAWMGTPVPLDAMPGMADESNIEALQAADGAEADRLFTELMIAHHEGGIAMADAAADDAETSRVRGIAETVARNQRNEIGELEAALARSGS
jgi:uncharacterized protein (DUF305 family)